jgi:DNA modification methylase
MSAADEALRMTPLVDDPDVTLYLGDALEQLTGLPDASVQMILTSPPFFSLRDYGTARWVGGDADCDHAVRDKRWCTAKSGLEGGKQTTGHQQEGYRYFCHRCGAHRVDRQIGLEESPEAWVDRLVPVFREARRVLRPDGVCWIEVGDSYAGGGRGGHTGSLDGSPPQGDADYPRVAVSAGYKPKDLIGAPWMLAFALREDGWYLRADVIWERPNPMPESMSDRPTKAHSYVFLLSKRPTYFYDADAIREEGKDWTKGVPDAGTLTTDNGGRKDDAVSPGRNARTVWTIVTEPTGFKHFATMPTDLAVRCVAAGTSERGCCPHCGAPWERCVFREGESVAQRMARATKAYSGHMPRGDGGSLQRNGARVGEPGGRPATMLGWRPTCRHYDDDYARLPRASNRRKREQRERSGNWWRRALRRPGGVGWPTTPCVVLDPFMGSGTTALVARNMGRHAVGVELSEEYLGIARERLQQLSLFA